MDVLILYTVYERAIACICCFGLFKPGFCVVGLILVQMIQPGVAYAVKNSDTEEEESFSTVDALLDLVR